MSKLYTIDLPNPYSIDGSWVCVTGFPTEKEAIEFAKKQFGADADGKISLISEVDDD